jgi:hypothetical protein
MDKEIKENKLFIEISSSYILRVLEILKHLDVYSIKTYYSNDGITIKLVIEIPVQNGLKESLFNLLDLYLND